MDILNYSDGYIKEIVSKLLNENIEVVPIGNHELQRHLVYIVKNESGIIGVVKLYYKKNRWNREVASLKFLEGSGVKAPKILKLGKLCGGTEWLFMEHKEGEVFAKVKDVMSEDNVKEIYETMGEQLGKIHSLKTFDFFGNWDENGKSIDNKKDFSRLFRKNVDEVLKELFDQHLEEEPLQRQCAEILKGKLNLVDDVKVSYLHNGDFGERNILVKKVDNKWELSALIDFEHCIPYDRDSEIIDCYYKLTDENQKFAEAFKLGYEKYMKFSNNLGKKKQLYELYRGRSICSWAKIQAPDYYWEGINILKKYS
ncbi:aminoglycoside phosphotransferase family protein [Clostridium sp. FP1]|uniref:aminoglycoside phosphotransferase family protein n=1 Tax=Clostridium sp. FP1 TaxID=2724076 RepID=UPI0013E92410|nr:aminoglycoside phosphotransferase family protein [Clostridium sp. FP1]MBZ9636490.1 aminoglycoside phosphotransferase family protein [Clostridium sp. FP1]